MWPALPTSDYYGDSATPWCHQPTVGLPVAVLAARRGGRHRGASHVHRIPVGGGGAQLYPCSIAPGQPQPSPGPRRRDRIARHRVGRHLLRRATHCLGPDPPGLGPLTSRGASTTGSVSLHRPALLAGPGRLAVPPRPYVVRTAPASPAPPGISCPQLRPTVAAAGGGV